MRLLPIGRYNLIIDLFSDPSSFGFIPALPVAAPCSLLHDAILLLSLQAIRFLLQVQAQSLDKYLGSEVLELNLPGLESPTHTASFESLGKSFHGECFLHPYNGYKNTCLRELLGK